jgi:AcrR family transcriptional regulator
MEAAAPQPSAPTTQAIVDASTELLEAGGPAAVSVRRVSERLGVSRQIIYTRFGAKAGLIRALHDEGFRRLSARVERVSGDLGAGERLEELALAYRESALAAPELFEIMFGHPIAEFEPDAEAIAVARTSFEPIASAAEAWIEECGATGETSPRKLARMCWSATHGLVALELAGHGDGNPQKAIRDSISTLLAGVRAGLRERQSPSAARD